LHPQLFFDNTIADLQAAGVHIGQASLYQSLPNSNLGSLVWGLLRLGLTWAQPEISSI